MTRRLIISTVLIGSGVLIALWAALASTGGERTYPDRVDFREAVITPVRMERFSYRLEADYTANIDPLIITSIDVTFPDDLSVADFQVVSLETHGQAEFVITLDRALRVDEGMLSMKIDTVTSSDVFDVSIDQ